MQKHDRFYFKQSYATDFLYACYSSVQPRWGCGLGWCANPGLHPGLAMLNPFRVLERSRQNHYIEDEMSMTRDRSPNLVS
jgi:hypothetical protein